MYDELFEGFGLPSTIQIPDQANHSGVALNSVAIRKALEFLGIEKPLIIKWSSGRYRYGAHRWNRKKNAHSVTLSHYRGRYLTSETLWHELTHAKQLERDFNCDDKEFNVAYNREGKSGGVYQRNKFEIEARKIAYEQSHILLCH